MLYQPIGDKSVLRSFVESELLLPGLGILKNRRQSNAVRLIAGVLKADAKISWIFPTEKFSDCLATNSKRIVFEEVSSCSIGDL